MQNGHPLRTTVLIWLAWAIVLIGFQALATARYQPRRPDDVLSWTTSETRAGSQDDKPYLVDPFMNQQVSWDSEFYLSIATVGYDDPAVRAISADFYWDRSRYCVAGQDQPCYSLNYAFFPAYPYLTRLVALPLRVLRLTPIATSTLAGVIVSLLGTLGAMLALYDLTRDELGEAGGLRTAFYLVIFPTGFFLATIYTEGLFLGLCFGCMALVRRKQWVWASLLAALATWTRAGGVALIIPLGIAWLREASGMPRSWKTWGKALLALSPVAAYLIWRYFLGTQFYLVEHNFFGRETLALNRSWQVWSEAWSLLSGSNEQTVVYYGVEFAAIALGVVACLVTLRRYPDLSLFGLAVIVIALSSGGAQGMHRYVLAAPSVLVVLSRLGKNAVFDKGWTLLSTLLMGLYATLFAFDMWAG